MNEWVSGWASERTSERASERASGRVSERVCEERPGAHSGLRKRSPPDGEVFAQHREAGGPGGSRHVFLATLFRSTALRARADRVPALPQ